MKKHTLQIYQRPSFGMGGAFINSFEVSNYKDRTIALGGFDTASCTINLPVTQAQSFLANYIGCVARTFVTDPMTPKWEGLITRITWRVGGVTYTRSMDEMYNRTRVTYFDANAGTPATAQTARSDDAVSIAQYGYREGNFDLGVHYNSANITHLTTYRNTALLRAYPQISAASSDSNQASVIEIEMQGLMYFAFDWNNYQSTDTTLTNAGALFQRVSIGVDRSPNASFVIEDTTAYPTTADKLIQGNSAFQMTRESRTGQTYLQFMQSIVEGGDGTQQWVWGITPFDSNSTTRRVYYRPASTAVKYTYSALSDAGRLRDVYGAIVNPWDVRPDAVVQVTDVLQFWSSYGDDPRLGYISSVDYDGETGTVQWQTGDNITMEGAIGTNRYFKPHGMRLKNMSVRQTR